MNYILIYKIVQLFSDYKLSNNLHCVNRLNEKIERMLQSGGPQFTSEPLQLYPEFIYLNCVVLLE